MKKNNPGHSDEDCDCPSTECGVLVDSSYWATQDDDSTDFGPGFEVVSGTLRIVAHSMQFNGTGYVRFTELAHGGSCDDVDPEPAGYRVHLVGGGGDLSDSYFVKFAQDEDNYLLVEVVNGSPGGIGSSYDDACLRIRRFVDGAGEILQSKQVNGNGLLYAYIGKDPSGGDYVYARLVTSPDFGHTLYHHIDGVGGYTEVGFGVAVNPSGEVGFGVVQLDQLTPADGDAFCQKFPLLTCDESGLLSAEVFDFLSRDFMHRPEDSASLAWDGSGFAIKEDASGYNFGNDANGDYTAFEATDGNVTLRALAHHPNDQSSLAHWVTVDLRGLDRIGLEYRIVSGIGGTRYFVEVVRDANFTHPDFGVMGKGRWRLVKDDGGETVLKSGAWQWQNVSDDIDPEDPLRGIVFTIGICISDNIALLILDDNFGFPYTATAAVDSPPGLYVGIEVGDNPGAAARFVNWLMVRRHSAIGFPEDSNRSCGPCVYCLLCDGEAPERLTWKLKNGMTTVAEGPLNFAGDGGFEGICAWRTNPVDEDRVEICDGVFVHVIAGFADTGDLQLLFTDEDGDTAFFTVNLGSLPIDCDTDFPPLEFGGADPGFDCDVSGYTVEIEGEF